MVAIVDAQPTPVVRLDPKREWMVLAMRPSLPSIAELSEPELRLAGLRINPRTNGPSRARGFTSLTLRKLSDLSERPVTGLPDKASISFVNWSPDGRMFAFTVTREDHIELWVADAASARGRRLGTQSLNALYGVPYMWLSDSKTIVAKMIPENRGTIPEKSPVPQGPVVQENMGGRAPGRTYQDMLTGPHDELVFEHYMAAQLALVTIDGKTTPIGAAGMISSMQPSPDAKYMLVETIHRPFSYTMELDRFPNRIEVWDRKGTAIHQVADIPLAENVPIAFGSVPTGPREVTWRADAPATLYWAEARDGGDPATEAAIRDEVMMLAAPFNGKPVSLVKFTQRYGGVIWGNDRTALASDWWWKTRHVRTLVIDPANPGSEPRVLFDRSWEDRYNDPGTPVSEPTANGTSVLNFSPDGKSIYLTSEGASPEGNRPFVDQLNIAPGKSERLWRSEAPYYESPITIIDGERLSILTSRETPDQRPNYFMRTPATGEVRQLTNFPHPYPQLAGIQKELIRYERADGVKLTATLYLPAGYTKEQGPLPTLMWAYPQEFKSAAAAGQLTDSPYRFKWMSWGGALPWLTQGYAVLDDPAMPIIGEGDKEPNDTFIEQLVADAKAAIDEGARRGVVDPQRVAVGGHSYGAFMTANLLAHSDLFRAGIARSGAYNRTLTPFSFQSEERSFWEAPKVYIEMSPFTYADKIDEPLLLIHGAADNNPGTFPMQSERLYEAMKGLGGTVRLVMLPNESHGYQARESVLHMLWEMNQWLEKYVKNAAPKTTGRETVQTKEG
jgi:dipeptidyl aminopeptidase/acylaminoacyl peptidase